MSEKDVWKKLVEQAESGAVLLMITLVRRVAPGVFDPTPPVDILENTDMIKELNDFVAGRGEAAEAGAPFIVVGGEPHSGGRGSIVIGATVGGLEIEMKVVAMVQDRLRDVFAGRETATLYVMPHGFPDTSSMTGGTVLARHTSGARH